MDIDLTGPLVVPAGTPVRDHYHMPWQQDWYEPGPEAQRMLAAIAEGFCPADRKIPRSELDAERRCAGCGAKWGLVYGQEDTVIGWSAEWAAGNHTATVAGYPYGGWRSGVTGWPGQQFRMRGTWAHRVAR